MNFNDFSKIAQEGFNLIPLIREIEGYDKEAIDVYSQHFDDKKSFSLNLLRVIKIGVDIQLLAVPQVNILKSMEI